MILTVSTFALAVPVLVQEKRQSCFDEAHIPRDVVNVLGKRTLDDLHMLWDGPWRFGNVWGEPAEDDSLSDEEEEHVQEVHAPQPNIAQVQVPDVHVPGPPPGLAEEPVQEVHAPPPNLLAGPDVPEFDFPLYDPPESDSESMMFGDDAPPASPAWSFKSEYWHTPPSSPSRVVFPAPPVVLT